MLLRTMSMIQKNILIGCTGSVASIKLPNLISELKSKDSTFNVSCLPSVARRLLTIPFQIRVVLTEKAKQFVDLEQIQPSAEVLLDENEWKMWKNRGDPILHIDLVKWADIFVIAPLDANTLGKMSSGICDNLLTCIARAWDVEKPLLFCPAMNTRMFLHPITSRQIEDLRDFGYYEIKPISKTLMCGDTGIGAMAEVNIIANQIVNHLSLIKLEENSSNQ
jgi:phosphopantothenoylcysteine decarboxylase